MSFVDVKSYFKTRMNGLSYTEWTDGFNFENLPDTVFDRAYHVSIGTITTGPANQLTHEFNFPVVVRVFIKGYADASAAIDSAMTQVDTILDDILDPANRLTQTDIKDIVPDNVNVRAWDISNDNDLVLELGFSAILICKF